MLNQFASDFIVFEAILMTILIKIYYSIPVLTCKKPIEINEINRPGSALEMKGSLFKRNGFIL
jgi:hypothetical protein